MPSPRVHVTGDRELASILHRLGSNTGLDEAVRAGAHVVQADAKRRCRSTTVAAVIRVQRGASVLGDATWDVQAQHERAAIEEFGSGPRAGLRGPHNYPARPYLRPALDESQPAVLATVKASLRARLNRR